MNIVTKAFTISRKYHAKQRTKVKNYPFFTHPLRVANILIQESAKENVICAGLLHDTVEDTKLTLNEIKNEFGNEISSLVKFATENMTKPWETRKEEMIASCQNCSEDELLLEFADKLSNLEMIHDEFFELGKKVYSKRGKEEIKNYYQRMYDIFEKRLPKLKNLKRYERLFNDLFNRI